MSQKVTHVLFVANSHDIELHEFGDLGRYLKDHCKALHPDWVYVDAYHSNLDSALAYLEREKAVTAVVINHVKGYSREQMKQFAADLSYELKRQSQVPSVFLIDTGVGVAYLRPIFQKHRIPVAVNTENNLIDILVDFDEVFGDRSQWRGYGAGTVDAETQQAQNGKLQEQLAFMDF